MKKNRLARQLKDEGQKVKGKLGVVFADSKISSFKWRFGHFVAILTMAFEYWCEPLVNRAACLEKPRRVCTISTGIQSQVRDFCSLGSSGRASCSRGVLTPKSRRLLSSAFNDDAASSCASSVKPAEWLMWAGGSDTSHPLRCPEKCLKGKKAMTCCQGGFRKVT